MGASGTWLFLSLKANLTLAGFLLPGCLLISYPFLPPDFSFPSSSFSFPPPDSSFPLFCFLPFRLPLSHLVSRSLSRMFSLVSSDLPCFSPSPLFFPPLSHISSALSVFSSSLLISFCGFPSLRLSSPRLPSSTRSVLRPGGLCLLMSALRPQANRPTLLHLQPLCMSDGLFPPSLTTSSPTGSYRPRLHPLCLFQEMELGGGVLGGRREEADSAGGHLG